MSAGYSLAGAILLSLLVGTSQPVDPQSKDTGSFPAAADPGIDRYLDGRYRLLEPDRLPNAREVAFGCDSATSDAIRELERGGAIVDPTYDTTVVRNLECRPAGDDPRIAACHFQQASIPLHVALEGGASARDYVARLPEREWSRAAARFALVAWANPQMGSEPSWIATDTCQPFTFRGEGWEIDLREMARQRRQRN